MLSKFGPWEFDGKKKYILYHAAKAMWASLYSLYGEKSVWLIWRFLSFADAYTRLIDRTDPHQQDAASFKAVHFCQD